MEIQKLQRTAAEVLAACVYEVYPGVKLLHGGLFSYGFYYDFFFPHPVHPQLHLQIEERMRQIVKEARLIKDLEMVAVSARGFLKSKGFFEKADSIDDDGLYSLVQIGDFVDLSLGPHLESTDLIPAFKLFPVEELGDRQIRISGIACESRFLLKDFVKKHNAYEKKSHIAKGEQKSYLTSCDGQVLLLPAGIKARNELLEKFKEGLGEKSLEVDCLGESDGLAVHKLLLKDSSIYSVCEEREVISEYDGFEELGMFDPFKGKGVRFVTSTKNLSSFLQNIEKTLKILGFSYSLCFTSSGRNAKHSKIFEATCRDFALEYLTSEENAKFPKIDFLVKDALGRNWSSVSVSAQDWLVIEVLLERNLALLLELS